MTHILKTENLKKKFGERVVVNGVSIEAKTGEITGLFGPNGAGKSTTFYMIAGLLVADEGKIFLDDYDLTDYPVYMRARKGIGYLPQEASIFRGLTARENIKAVLQFRDLTENEIEEKTDSLLEEFGLNHVADTKGSYLSGGERRRVEIARALATDPLFILLDEPFAGIDPITIIELQEIIIKLKKRGIGIILTDHNIKDSLRITDKAFILSNGSILKIGTPGEIAQDEEIKEIYLGKDFKLD
ncbi:lipopolysaccharide export system ATP-binding protein [Thermotomaculum hydrothermale]|uniref:Lipopolysaccharide export system ATP-binding protein n=1 Tax=Thermotomaculum hydrothermale TaxID=981385 RepID=A0A7R6PMI3_9BACT|nr:LPS export ABC transporter ATP-binding protein [Thermotomaculum hydrothermale]BBB32303.1 lipopolysaccharide export system ATP-binding protein [Thermotomaculum hydrothermale]